MPDPETITLRATEIGGQCDADDSQVIWRSLPTGRIMRASGVSSDEQQWAWNCYVYGKPSSADDNGTGRDLDDAKAPS